MAVSDYLDVLPGIGSVAASLITSSKNVQLAREQREWDYKMWKENNAYNTPSNQVKRLRDAGLNPGIAMMNGVMDSGLSSQSAGGQSPAQVDYNSLAEGLRQSVDLFQNNQVRKAEVRSLDANTQATNIRNKTQLLRDLADLNKTISETSSNNAYKQYLIKQRDYLAKQIDAFDGRNEAEVQRIEQERRLLYEKEQTERVMRSVNQKLVQENIRLSKAQQSKLNADVKYVVESINQMVMNGASQREINSFIRDKERETARSLHLENENWYQSYQTRLDKERSETQRNRREHLTESIKFFGIPIGTTERINQYDQNGRYIPSPLW